MKLRIAMTILSQDLFDLDQQMCVSLKDEKTRNERWDARREKLFSDVEELTKKFELDKSALLKYLKGYCSMNGLVVGRCMLCKERAVSLY
jgi:hypothetical protein